MKTHLFSDIIGTVEDVNHVAVLCENEEERHDRMKREIGKNLPMSTIRRTYIELKRMRNDIQSDIHVG